MALFFIIYRRKVPGQRHMCPHWTTPARSGTPGGRRSAAPPAPRPLRHKAHQLPAGHLAQGPLLNDPAVFFLAEHARHQPRPRRQMTGHTHAVLLGGQIDHTVRPGENLPGDGAAPEAVQVRRPVHRELRLHLQPVGRHAVEGPQKPVKAGQDIQVLLHIVQLRLGKHAGSHILILDALVGQKGRRQIPAQIHGLQTPDIQAGNLVIAPPQGLQLTAGHGPQPLAQPLRLVQKHRQPLAGEAVRVHPHPLCGRNDDLHRRRSPVTAPAAGSPP